MARSNHAWLTNSRPTLIGPRTQNFVGYLQLDSAVSESSFILSSPFDNAVPQFCMQTIPIRPETTERPRREQNTGVGGRELTATISPARVPSSRHRVQRRLFRTPDESILTGRCGAPLDRRLFDTRPRSRTTAFLLPQASRSIPPHPLFSIITQFVAGARRSFVVFALIGVTSRRSLAARHLNDLRSHTTQ